MLRGIVFVDTLMLKSIYEHKRGVECQIICTFGDYVKSLYIEETPVDVVTTFIGVVR